MVLDNVRAYIGLGWSVVPILPGSKKPAIPWSEFTKRRMTLDEAEAIWSAHPEYGVAIVTGAISGIIVIDVDPQNGGDVHGVLSKLQPGQPYVETGGGGAHVYCKHPGGYVPSGPTLLTGVDRKGDHGYVIAPPSVHPNGRTYRWVHIDDSVASVVLEDPPDWLMRKPESAPEDDGPWVADSLLHPEGVLPGTQHSLLVRLCWWAAGHLDQDIAQSILSRWVQRLPLGDYRPWTEEDVETRLESAYAKRPPLAGKAGTVEGAQVDAKASGLREAVRTAKDFVTETEATAEDVEWIVPDLVAPGCWTEIIGAVKEGKSTFLCGMIAAINAGEPYLNRPTRSVKTLYLTEQVGLSFLHTLRRAGLDKSEDVLVLTIADLFGVPWNDAVSVATDIAVETGCKILVVDTLSRLAAPQDEDSATESIKMMKPFDKARSANMAVVFVRHERKQGGSVNTAGRGSSAISGDMDICLQLEAPNGVADPYRVLYGISRLTDQVEEHLKYVDGTYQVGRPPSAKREALEAPTVAYFAAMGPGLVTLAKLTSDLVEAGERDARGVARDVMLLLKKGVIVKEDGKFKLVATGDVVE